MMARGHAATGAAGIALLGVIPGFIPGYLALIACVVVGAGFALWSDMDHPKATAATTWGWLSKSFAKLLERISAFIYYSTRRGRDAKRQGGHRTFTHTLFFAILSGIGTYFAAQSVLGMCIVLFMGFCLGLRGLFEKVNKYGKLNLWFMAAVPCVLLYTSAQLLVNPITLAIVVLVATFIHSLGDCLTNSGAPLMWPLPIQGRLWYRFKAPVRFDTGSEVGKDVEKTIKVICVLFILCVFAWRITATYYLGWGWYA